MRPARSALIDLLKETTEITEEFQAQATLMAIEFSNLAKNNNFENYPTFTTKKKVGPVNSHQSIQKNTKFQERQYSKKELDSYGDQYFDNLLIGMSKRTKKPLNQSFMKRMRRVFPEVSTHDLRIRIKRLISEGKIIDMCENADDAEQNSTNKQQISPSEQQKHQRQFLDSQNQIDGNQTQNNQTQNESQTDNNATIFNNNNNNNTVFNNNATVFNNNNATVFSNNNATVLNNANTTVFNNENATVFNNNNNATVLNNANTTVFNNENATVFNNNNNDTVLNNANTIVFNNDNVTVFNDNATVFNDNATVFNDNATVFNNDNATVFNNEETQYQVNNNKQIEINQSQINKLHELLTQQAIKSVGGHEELIKQIYDYLLRSNHGTSSEILHQMILQLARQNPASDPAPPNPTPLAIDEAQNVISKLDEFNPLDPILNDDTNLDIDDNPQEDL